MNTKELHTVYFLGIGGIGMSALARYFKAHECKVSGFDKTRTDLTEQLEKEGIGVHYNEDIAQIPDPIKEGASGALVVYTPAISDNHKEFNYLKQRGIQLYKRSEVLGEISRGYFTIAVAGTHGKTTTCSIIAHILKELQVDCIAFIGGVSLNFKSNLLLKEGSSIMVVEADEYDRSFLTLSPDIAIVLSLDPDHLDVYGDQTKVVRAYNEFVDRLKPNGILIARPDVHEKLSSREDIECRSYSLTRPADVVASDLQVKSGNYFFNITQEGLLIKDVRMGLPGVHNVENALGAITVVGELEEDLKKAAQTLTSYKGVQRRFQVHINGPDFVYIDDYAHHPSEITMCIQSIRELYPGKKITGVFQPHLYSRTKDFADGFAKSLSLLDELILLEIYPAREQPINGVDSGLIEQKVKIKNKCVLKKEELIHDLKLRDIEVLITMGAGDIDVLVEPIKDHLYKRVAKVG